MTLEHIAPAAATVARGRFHAARRVASSPSSTSKVRGSRLKIHAHVCLPVFRTPVAHRRKIRRDQCRITKRRKTCRHPRIRDPQQSRCPCFSSAFGNRQHVPIQAIPGPPWWPALRSTAPVRRHVEVLVNSIAASSRGSLSKTRPDPSWRWNFGITSPQSLMTSAIGQRLPLEHGQASLLLEPGSTGAGSQSSLYDGARRDPSSKGFCRYGDAPNDRALSPS